MKYDKDVMAVQIIAGDLCSVCEINRRISTVGIPKIVTKKLVKLRLSCHIN